ncbi:putative acetyltransferase [Janibacter sp. HTCC2649]|uniref:arylamine N-acetyltransferase family protein n=1 Tax=Janibacter sp. HTCC2649 TaxID=313589 RepID=UPI000067195A|nr:arylamine N-acetyltransferase [Janibacter sp. HTCC2649]EAP97811.1 putative acetyltransferase [Janibacter sp. HTCC2649]
MTDALPADLWLTETLDLDAYLARTGAAAEPPSLEALTRLQTAHIRTFTFDNLDVLLGTHPGVSLPAIQEKFVGRGRGGYCFEHASLFAAVLHRLGYAVTRHLGRVGDPQLAPRTHLVVMVDLEGERFICDPGFGRSPLAPIPLVDGADVTAEGWRHGIRTISDGTTQAWEVLRHTGDEWEVMHTIDSLPVRPVDVAMGHHWTSTQPTSHFMTSLMCVAQGTDEDGTALIAALTEDSVTIRRPGRPTEHRAITPDDFDSLPELIDSLGANLTPAEGVALVDVVRRLRSKDQS